MVKHIKLSLLACSFATLLITGCGDYGNEGNNIVGSQKFISVEPLFEISSSAMQPIVTQLTAQPDNPNTDINESLGKPAFGIKGYKIIYSTKNERGEDIKASGLVTVPVPTKVILDGLKAKGKSYSMSIVSDQHGTIFPDSQAPTSAAKSVKLSGNNPMAMLAPDAWTLKPVIASSAIGGFVTIQPDYIGFGESVSELHPYLLEKSSANSVVDLIEATLKFGNDNNLPLNGQIFLTGYSEGGYVTLAAAKEIESNHPDITLKGIAPMSGPYDLNLTGMGVLAPDLSSGTPDYNTTMGRPDFIAGIVYSYSTDLGLELDKIVNEPYASRLPTLYDAEKNATYIQSQLTHSIVEFFNPNYRADFLTNPQNSLRDAFIKNSVDNFKPKAPTKLLYCSGDTTIDYRISLSAAQKMGVEAVDLNSSLGHTECATPAYNAAITWFDELRSK